MFGIESYKNVPGVSFAKRDATWMKKYFENVLGIPKNRIYHKTDSDVGLGAFRKVFSVDGWLDKRKKRPYSGYENFNFDVPVGKNGDIYDRYLVRVAELRQSREIVKQAVDKLPTGPYKVDDNKISLPPRNTLKSSMEALIHHFKLVSEGISVPKGETYVPTEGPRGEVGFYIISDGGNVPSRVKLRAPSYMAVPGMCEMMKDCFIADVVGVIGSIDIVMGEVDR